LNFLPSGRNRFSPDPIYFLLLKRRNRALCQQTRRAVGLIDVLDAGHRRQRRLFKHLHIDLRNGSEGYPALQESRDRRQMYRAEEKRNTLMQTSHTDIADFLRQCGLTLELFVPRSEEEKMRCYELVVRTNQLNMSGIKYTPEEFDAVLARPDHKIFAFSCADQFGSYGIVGFGQYRIESKTMVFTEFAMSCRVAGKFVESALFSALLASEGCTGGNFTVQKTKKNTLLRNTLESIGFTARQDDDNSVSYTFCADLHNHDLVQVRILQEATV